MTKNKNKRVRVIITGGDKSYILYQLTHTGTHQYFTLFGVRFRVHIYGLCVHFCEVSDLKKRYKSTLSFPYIELGNACSIQLSYGDTEVISYYQYTRLPQSVKWA